MTSDQPGDGADPAVRALIAAVGTHGATRISGPRSHNAGRPIRELPHGALEFTGSSRRLAGTAGPDAWISPGLAAARFLFMLTGRRDLALIAPFSGGLERFCADGRNLGGSAYGAALFGTGPGQGQARGCAAAIASRPGTKRAAAALYDPVTGGGTTADTACCMGLVFSPRDGRLDTSVLMRANDAMRLLPYNVFEFSLLGEFLARVTGLEPGTYRHMAVTMHLRGDDDIAAAATAASRPGGGPDMGPMPPATWTLATALANLHLDLAAALARPRHAAPLVRDITARAADTAGPYWGDLAAAAGARGLARCDPPAGPSPLAGGSPGPLLTAELDWQETRRARTAAFASHARP